MSGSWRAALLVVCLAGHAWAQDGLQGAPALSLRGAYDANTTLSNATQAGRAGRLMQGATPTRSLSAPTCAKQSDYTQNKDCAGAIAGSLGGLVGLLTKGFVGGWEEGDGKELLGSVLDLTQGLIEAHTVLPITLVSQLMFPMLKSLLGVAMDPPTEDTLLGYVTLNHIFERKLRSNQFRMDALQGELAWFDGLFLKDKTLINSSLVYKAAGLSHLLNLQHDFALDQALFFGAECLLTGDKSNFQQISAGQCSAQLEANYIVSWQLCEQAAEALDLRDVTVTNLSLAYGADKPYGCYYYAEGPEPGLFFNGNPDGQSQNASLTRQLLCSTSAVDGSVAAECRAWQQAGTWEVAAMYAITNLGVLVDIARQFPVLEETTRERVQTLTGKYMQLLNSSFSEYERHRMSFLEPPQLSNSGAVSTWCDFFGAAWWSGRYVTEGRDYFYQTGSDEKCRGPCDVMSYICDVRPERGGGKYCVDDPSKWGEAEPCFQRYTDDLKSTLGTTFGHVMGNLTELHDTVANLR